MVGNMNFPLQQSQDITRRIANLFSSGKKWRGWMETLPQAPHEHHIPIITRGNFTHLIQKTNAADIERKVKNNTARQLCLSLQLRTEDARMKVILDSLVHLVEANEISFSSYVNKLDHLYPELMKSLDANLKARVTSLLNHSN